MRAFWKPILYSVLIPVLLLGMIAWSGEVTAAQLDMTWTDNADNEAGFEIEQSIGPNGPFGWRDTVDPDVTSYNDLGLAPLTEYCYRVRAFNSAGPSDYSNVDCQMTTGENSPPTADAGPSQTVVLGDAVTLDGVGSTDPDGDLLTYCWDLGDGSASQCSEIHTHSYTAVGTYTVTLTVTDTGGLSDADTITITVTDSSSGGPLVITNLSVASGKSYAVVDNGLAVGALVYIDRTYPYTEVPAELVGTTFIQTANGDKSPNGNTFLTFEVNQPVTVYVAYDDLIGSKPPWLTDNFTDTGADLVATHTTLSLYAQDFPVGPVVLGGNNNGSQSMYTVVVVGLGGGSPPPSNNPPLAQASVDNANINVGELVTFDGSGSTDPDGDPLSYCWAFADGSLDQCGEIVTHSYAAAGTYTVTLTVTDDGGLSDADTVQVFVSQLNSPPAADAGGDQSVTVGELVTFDGVGSTDPDGDPLSYCWAFADGSLDQCGEIVTHSYAAAGTYTVTLTVTDDGGLSDTDTTLITVTDPSSGGPLEITNLSVASGKSYAVVDDGLTVGALVYIDRTYPYTEVPAELVGTTFIQTANGDKSSNGNTFLTFEVNQPVTVYVAYDDLIGSKPPWLTDNFTDTGADLVATHTTLSLYAQDFPVGPVVLGGNNNGSQSMYTVVVIGLDGGGPLEITNFSVVSGKAYEVVPNGLQDGARVFIDRSFTFSAIPAWLHGSTYLKTANNDKLSQGNQFLSFEVNQDVVVYIVHSDNYHLKPDWLANNFVDIGEDVMIAGETFSLFQATILAGEVILGGNVHPSEATNNIMYTVIIVGLD